jgi:hypothetical protein
MNADTEAAIRRIYEQWHETVVRRDIRGLMELYAEDAILESPLICAVQPELGSGIFQGKSTVSRFGARSACHNVFHDRALQADLEDALGDLLRLLGIERRAPFHRHVDVGDRERLALHHG